MKINPIIPVLAALGCAILLAGCSSAKPASPKNPTNLSPETVFITFHVKAGNEAELQRVLAAAWEVYRHEKLVLAEPHVILQGREIGGTRVVEIFTWVNHTVPDHVPDSVRVLWNRMQALCEMRDGHPGLEGGEVERIVPPVK